jgi:hypothetical protein
MPVVANATAVRLETRRATTPARQDESATVEPLVFRQSEPQIIAGLESSASTVQQPLVLRR